MVDLYYSGELEHGPSEFAYNPVIDTFAKRGDIEGANYVLGMMNDDFDSGNMNAKPNFITYKIMIKAWIKSDKKDATQEALNYLKKMINLHSKGEFEQRPDAFIYTSIINIHARRGDIEGANDVLKMMKNDFKSGNIHAKPSTYTYNILINGWSKSGHDDAPSHAKNLLRKIGALHSR